MRVPAMALLVTAAMGCSGEDAPAPLVTDTCDDPASAQCAVYTLPADWPVDVRAVCESNGGTWDAPCPEAGRVGTCTCTGLEGISTVVYYYDVPWRTAAQAAANCTNLGCDWTVP